MQEPFLKFMLSRVCIAVNSIVHEALRRYSWSGIGWWLNQMTDRKVNCLKPIPKPRSILTKPVICWLSMVGRLECPNNVLLIKVYTDQQGCRILKGPRDRILANKVIGSYKPVSILYNLVMSIASNTKEFRSISINVFQSGPSHWKWVYMAHS